MKIRIITSIVFRDNEVPHTNHDATYGTSITFGPDFSFSGNSMSFLLVLAMTAAELFGNAHLKWYAENGRGHHLGLGFFAWLLVLLLLIQTFMKGKSLMWTCIMWEALIVLGGALTAYLVFGEKFTHWFQWLGGLFAVAAAVCINWDCSDK